MNRLLLVCLLLVSLTLPTYAVEPVDPEDEEPAATELPVAEVAQDDRNVIVNVILPADASAADPEELPADIQLPADSEPAPSVFTVYALNERSDAPSDEPALHAAVVQLFGEYSPRTQTVTQYLDDGSSVSYTQMVSGVAGLDWEWISEVSLFALVLFSVLRLIGGLLKL